MWWAPFPRSSGTSTGGSGGGTRSAADATRYATAMTWRNLQDPLERCAGHSPTQECVLKFPEWGNKFVPPVIPSRRICGRTCTCWASCQAGSARCAIYVSRFPHVPSRMGTPCRIITRWIRG